MGIKELTDNEFKTMKAIYENAGNCFGIEDKEQLEYLLQDNYTCFEAEDIAVATSRSSKSIGGTMASLEKKGWIMFDGEGLWWINPYSHEAFIQRLENIEKNNKKVLDVATEIDYDSNNQVSEEKQMTTVSTKIVPNVGPRFNKIGKSEMTRRELMARANSGKGLNLKKFADKLNWSESQAKEAIRYYGKEVNCKANFDQPNVKITWK